MQRIQRLSKELSKALDKWIEEDMGGESWLVRIYPSSIRSDVIYLENIEYVADVIGPRSTATHKALPAA
ncbi:hypothetical protein ABWH97_13860 [Nitratireductor sp. ac15]